MSPFEFLGPYRVVELIGRGGMGSVYRATDSRTGQQVAIKLISPTVADDQRFRQRFVDEVEALKRLKHPNIVLVLGEGEQDGHLYYSMELVEGESLQQLLRRQRRLDWAPVLDMAVEICSALKHAHDFGIIHRDLKPANLLLNHAGQTKLVDFGIAKLFGNPEQTAAGAMLGTADYMAPEQATGGPITARTDLYALGNILYACFAGRPPFAGRTLTRVVESLGHETPTRIDLINPDLPLEIAELVHDLLEKRPQDRPPTALAVMNRVKAIRAGLSRGATQADSDRDTVLPSQPQPPGASSTAPPTVSSGEDHKTLGHLDIDDATSSLPAGSDEVTIEAAGSAAGSSASPPPGGQALFRSGVSGQRVTAEPAPPAAPTTRFKSVEEHERRRSRFDSEAAAHQYHRLTQILSVVLLLALLLAGGGVIYWATRRPGPDQLHQMIQLAEQQGDIDLVRSRVDQFVRLYPDDPRAEELAESYEPPDIQRIAKRLRMVATRRGGSDQLTAAEQAFLAAIQDSEHHPAATRRRLRAWLDIYQPAAEQDPTLVGTLPQRRLAAMVQAAEAHWQQLDRRELPPHDRRAEELFQQMRWAEANLAPVARRRLYEGIVKLLDDTPWAEPAVAEAQRRLTELDEHPSRETEAAPLPLQNR